MAPPSYAILKYSRIHSPYPLSAINYTHPIDPHIRFADNTINMHAGINRPTERRVAAKGNVDRAVHFFIFQYVTRHSRTLIRSNSKLA